MSNLEDLTKAAEALRKLDQRRKDQQAYLDDLIAAAAKNGHGWAEIKRATGMMNRSLQLAMKRISNK